MLYQSKYADLQVLVRSASPIFHQATGVQIGQTRELTAHFGHHAGEFMLEDPLTGEVGRHAQIYGHFCDTDAEADRLGWTDDERESVEITLDNLCKMQPYLIAKVEQQAHVPFTPEKPWPNYDETHWRTIPVLARQLGLVDKVLSYERENANRASVIKELEAPAEAETEVLPDEKEMITL